MFATKITELKNKFLKLKFTESDHATAHFEVGSDVSLQIPLTHSPWTDENSRPFIEAASEKNDAESHHQLALIRIDQSNFREGSNELKEIQRRLVGGQCISDFTNLPKFSADCMKKLYEMCKENTWNHSDLDSVVVGYNPLYKNESLERLVNLVHITMAIQSGANLINLEPPIRTD